MRLVRLPCGRREAVFVGSSTGSKSISAMDLACDILISLSVAVCRGRFAGGGALR